MMTMETMLSTSNTPDRPPLGLPGPHEHQERQEDQDYSGNLDHQGLHEHQGPHGHQGVQGNRENLDLHEPHDPPGAHEDQGGHEPLGDQELSVPEAAVSTGLSISTIRRLINGGRLPARYERGDKGQHKYFIQCADLATLVELGKASGPDLRLTPAGPRPGARGDHGVQGDQPAQRDGVHGALSGQAGQPGGAHGAHEDPSPGDRGALGDQAGPAAGAHGVHTAEPLGDHGSLEEYTAQLELAVVRERLAGAQEAVRLHAERVRAQAKDVGFLQAQLDQSREAERELRILLARLSTALPAPGEPKALEAKNVTPERGKARWWWLFGRRG